MVAVARMRSVVIDCPDSRVLAEFYRDLLGWKIEYAGYEEGDEDSWTTMTDGGPVKLCLQQVADYQPPRWPGQERPQQFHLDLTVDDLDQAEQQVLALGAVKAEFQPGTSFRVFLDPAGHPFCLCVD
jgi:predicted enzyme related to lactoylglutathione lyase